MTCTKKLNKNSIKLFFLNNNCIYKKQQTKTDKATMLNSWWQTNDDEPTTDSWFDFDDDQMIGGAKSIKAPGILSDLNAKSIPQSIAYRKFLYSKGLGLDDSDMKTQNDFKKLYNSAKNKQSFINKWQNKSVKSPVKSKKAHPPAKKAPAAKKSPVKKSPVKKTAKKSPVKRKTAKKSPVKRKTAKKSPAKRKTAKKSPVKRKTAKKSPFQKFQRARDTNYAQFKANFMSKPGPLVIDGKTIPRSAAVARQAYLQMWQKSPERSKSLAKKNQINGRLSPQKMVYDGLYGDQGSKYLAKHPEFQWLSPSQRRNVFASDPDTKAAYELLKQRRAGAYGPDPEWLSPQMMPMSNPNWPALDKSDFTRLTDEDIGRAYLDYDNNRRGIPSPPPLPASSRIPPAPPLPPSNFLRSLQDQKRRLSPVQAPTNANAVPTRPNLNALLI